MRGIAEIADIARHRRDRKKRKPEPRRTQRNTEEEEGLPRIDADERRSRQAQPRGRVARRAACHKSGRILAHAMIASGLERSDRNDG
jgi:hypothetical protein